MAPVSDEILIGTSFSPMAFTDLRAKIRESISCSGASEEGGGAAEASCFVEALCPKASVEHEDWVANQVEESGVAPALDSMASCGSCVGS